MDPGSGEKLDVFNTVQAEYTLHRKNPGFQRGLWTCGVVDAWTGRVILQEKIPSEFVWVNEWANFNGDERALNEDQARLAGTA